MTSFTSPIEFFDTYPHDLEVHAIDTQCSPQKFAVAFRTATDKEREVMVPDLEVLGHNCRSGFEQYCMPAISLVLLQCCSALQLLIGRQILSVGITKLPEALSKDLSISAMNIINHAMKQATSCLSGTDTMLMSELAEVYSEVLFSCMTSVKWSTEEVKHMLGFYDTLCAPVNKSIGSESRESRIKASTYFISSVLTLEMEGLVFASEVSTRVLTLFRAVKRVHSGLSGFVSKQFALALSVMADMGRPQPYLNERVWKEILRIWTPDVGEDPEACFLARKEAVEAAIVLSSFAMPDGRRKRYNILSMNRYAVSFANVVLEYIMKLDNRTIEVHRDEWDLLLLLSKRFTTLTAMFPSEQPERRCLEAFRVFSSCSDPVIKQNCALNLPAVAARAAHPCNKIHRREMKKLMKIFQDLTSDTEFSVREKVAQVFHNSIACPAETHADGLVKLVNKFLKDESPVVRQAITANLYPTLEVLAEASKELKLEPGFLRSESCKNWRTEEKIATQVGLTAPFWTQEQRKETLVPLLLDQFRSPCASVRKAAGLAFMRLVRSMHTIDDQKEVIKDFCSKACALGGKQKISLVETLVAAYDSFSIQVFRELFASELFTLSVDANSDVRFKVATNLHKAAAACLVMPKYLGIVDALTNDNDGHVRGAMEGFGLRASGAIRQARANVSDDCRRLEKEIADYEDLPSKGEMRRSWLCLQKSRSGGKSKGGRARTLKGSLNRTISTLRRWKRSVRIGACFNSQERERQNTRQESTKSAEDLNAMPRSNIPRRGSTRSNGSTSGGSASLESTISHGMQGVSKTEKSVSFSMITQEETIRSRLI